MDGLLAEVARTAVLDVAALFPIVNPVGNAPLFLSLTRGASPQTRRLLCRKIAINGFILLAASMLIGSHILAFFGISLPVVQVGGGLVLTATGWTLLSQPDEKPTDGTAVRTADAGLLHQAFYPLTLPLTVGPGSMSIAVTLGANAAGGLEQQLQLVVAALLAPAAIALAIYLAYRSSEHLERWFGASAMSVVLRLSSFILLCIGVQIIWNGVSALWLALPPR